MFESSPASQSSEPDEAAENDEKKKVPAAVVEEPTVKPKNPRIPYPKLNAAALLNAERGLPKLMETFVDRKWQGRGYEANNLNYLLFHLERWAKQLHPRWAASETIERVEELGKKREVKVFAKKIFDDMPTCMGLDAGGIGKNYILGPEGTDDGETLPMNRKLRGFHGDLDDDDADDDVFAMLNKAMGGASSGKDNDQHVDADLADEERDDSNHSHSSTFLPPGREEDDSDEDAFALLNQAMGIKVRQPSPENLFLDDNGQKSGSTANDAVVPSSSGDRQEDDSNDDPFGLLDGII